MARQWNSQLFVDGKWIDDDELPPIAVINPATEAVIGHIPDASPKTAIRAIEAARRAFDEGPWPWMKPAERAAVLRKVADALTERAAELREIVVAETGLVGMFTDYVQAAGSIGMFRSNADLAERGFE